MQNKVLKILNELKIPYQHKTHEAVFTIEQAEKVWGEREGLHCKNLFFRGKKGRQHYLVVADKNTTIPIKALGEKIGNERLGFASERRLDKYLKLIPGAVSPFGVINDAENHVIVLVDDKIRNAEKVSFHPNENTATVTLSGADFDRFLQWAGNEYRYLNFADV